MTSFFIDAGPYVLGALFVLLLITVWCALKVASDADDRLEVSPAQRAGDGIHRPPGSLSPVRADHLMREWDLEAAEYFTEWSQ